jgi:aerobic carbon-monoxide dehydrogenase medium subunit
MRPFEFFEPASLGEAVRLLDSDDPDIRPIGGGTALLLMMKSGFFRPRRLVSLRRIEQDYRGISAARDGSLRIGAMATLAEIERSADVLRHAPVIVHALRTLSNPRTRNVATIGGHLAHADPHLDLPPILAALDAQVKITGTQGERSIPVATLIRGYLETELRPGEIMAEVTVPGEPGRRAVYWKYTARSADDWPALGIAAAFTDAGLRIVIGAATDMPTRLMAAEAALGASRDEPGFRRAAEAAAAEAKLVSDQHGTASYKRELLRVGVRRALAQAVAS